MLQVESFGECEKEAPSEGKTGGGSLSGLFTGSLQSLCRLNPPLGHQGRVACPLYSLVQRSGVGLLWPPGVAAPPAGPTPLFLEQDEIKPPGPDSAICSWEGEGGACNKVQSQPRSQGSLFLEVSGSVKWSSASFFPH